MKRRPTTLLLFALPLFACGEASPIESLLPPPVERSARVSIEPKVLAELELEPSPLRELCIDRMDNGAFDTPICDALAPLRVVFDGALPIEVRAGESVELRLGLEETSGVGMFRYPGIAAFSHDPAASVEGTVQLFGIFGCQIIETPMVLSVSESAPPGAELVVEAEVMALEGSCEQAHRLALPVRVL